MASDRHCLAEVFPKVVWAQNWYLVHILITWCWGQHNSDLHRRLGCSRKLHVIATFAIVVQQTTQQRFYSCSSPALSCIHVFMTRCMRHKVGKKKEHSFGGTGTITCARLDCTVPITNNAATAFNTTGTIPITAERSSSGRQAAPLLGSVPLPVPLKVFQLFPAIYIAVYFLFRVTQFIASCCLYEVLFFWIELQTLPVLAVLAWFS